MSRGSERQLWGRPRCPRAEPGMTGFGAQASFGQLQQGPPDHPWRRAARMVALIEVHLGVDCCPRGDGGADPSPRGGRAGGAGSLEHRRSGECRVDLFDRAPLGLEAEQPKRHAGLPVPRAGAERGPNRPTRYAATIQ